METDISSNHILVLCRSQLYWFDVLDANSDVIITEKDLAANFKAIIEDAQATPVREAARSAVGVLSTENRRIWAGLREHLLKDDHGHDVPPNRESLQIVDSALFVLCLDDTEPVGAAKVAANVLSGSYRLEDGVQTGTCTNRWYDKLQIIVCKNGSAGINFERKPPFVFVI
jgi:carnitine O-acetyltransferase